MKITLKADAFVGGKKRLKGETVDIDAELAGSFGESPKSKVQSPKPKTVEPAAAEKNLQGDAPTADAPTIQNNANSEEK